MEDIAVINAGDNFIFSKVEVIQIPFEHKQYPSYRVSIQG